MAASTAVLVGLGASGAIPAPLLVTTAWAFGLVAWFWSMAEHPAFRGPLSPIAIGGSLVLIYGLIVPSLELAAGETILDGRDVSAHYAAASAISGAALFSLALGFRLRPGPGLRRDRFNRPTLLRRQSTSTLRLWSILAIASALAITTIAIEGWQLRVFRLGWDPEYAPGPSLGYLGYGPEVLGSTAFATACLARSRPLRRVAQVGLIVALLILVGRGVRYSALTFALAPALYWVLKGRSGRPVATRWMAVPGLAVGLGFLGLIGYHRGPSLPVRAAGLPEIAHSTGSAFQIFRPLAALMGYTADRGLVWGRSYLDIFVQPIPRVLWSSKPVPTIVEVVGSIADPLAGRAFPIWGEMWLNFGLPGVIVGMAVLGASLRFLTDVWHARRSRSRHADVIAALALPLILQWFSRGYLGQLLHNTFFVLAPALAVVANATKSGSGGVRP